MPRRIGAILSCVVVVALLPVVIHGFSITLLNYIGVYSLVALGLVLLTGVGGLTSFGQAAFVGLGAYATAWLTTAQGASPWLGLIAALVLTGGVGLILGLATLRLGGHFLPLSTLAWGIAFYYLFGNLDMLGRYNGIASIPPITLGPISFQEPSAIYYPIWICVGLSMWLSANFLDSREGRAIRSLRGGAAMAESMGINNFRTRLAVFVWAGLLAGVSGWLYAHLERYVSPSPFDVKPGIEYLLMALAGGFGSIPGAVVGAAAVTLLKNALQDVLPLLSGDSGQLEIVVFGILFIILLQQARAGIVPYIMRLVPRHIPPPPPDAPPLPRRALPATGTKLLEVAGATKRFGGLVAVNDVSFEVRAGEILGLIGPNGAGKSTMFNLISNIIRPDAGRIHFADHDITRLPTRRIAALGIARTFQHVKLRPSMTLLDNVALGAYRRTHAGFLAAALRLDRAEERAIRAEAMRLLKRFGLGDRPFELAGNLPLPNQRILEIARALAADPALIMLDEPAAGLRRADKQALAQMLRDLKQEGVTILLVEHDMEFVMGLVDRIVVMDFGSRLTEGSPAEVRNDPRVQEAYLGGVA
jgi:branched-chain amino acid transport system permease protein